jgi:ADP-ribosylglycohydrolase
MEPSQALVDRIRGCIYGAALGDALGIQTEFVNAPEAVEIVGPVLKFQPHEGSHSSQWASGDW